MRDNELIGMMQPFRDVNGCANFFELSVCYTLNEDEERYKNFKVLREMQWIGVCIDVQGLKHKERWRYSIYFHCPEQYDVLLYVFRDRIRCEMISGAAWVHSVDGNCVTTPLDGMDWFNVTGYRKNPNIVDREIAVAKSIEGEER